MSDKSKHQASDCDRTTLDIQDAQPSQRTAYIKPQERGLGNRPQKGLLAHFSRRPESHAGLSASRN